MGSGPGACSTCPSSAAAACPSAAAAELLAPFGGWLTGLLLLLWWARLSSDCACQRALRRCSSSVPGRRQTRNKASSEGGQGHGARWARCSLKQRARLTPDCKLLDNLLSPEEHTTARSAHHGKAVMQLAGCSPSSMIVRSAEKSVSKT